MIYLRKFETQVECDSYIGSEEYIEPFTGLIAEDSGKVVYNVTSGTPGPTPVDYRSMPLTIEITESNGNLALLQCARDNSTLYYRVNDGEWLEATEWQQIDGEMVLLISVQTNDKIQFKGNLWVGDGSSIMVPFFSTGATTSSLRYYIYGNIMSLIDAINYTNMTSFPDTYQVAFSDEFSYCSGLISAENLILPATALTGYCYDSMFQGCTSLTAAPELPATTLTEWCYASMFADCTSLTTAPELPATTLADNCYYQMFNYCSNLNYIKCLATDISASYCTTDWVYGVQTNSGTFIKDPNMSSWTTGDNGIPSNWTVEDIS